MLASRVLMTAGTPGHMYLVDRQEKCLETKGQFNNINQFKLLTSCNNVAPSRFFFHPTLDTCKEHHFFIKVNKRLTEYLNVNMQNTTIQCFISVEIISFQLTYSKFLQFKGIMQDKNVATKIPYIQFSCIQAKYLITYVIAW